MDFNHEKTPEPEETMRGKIAAIIISAFITLLVLYGISEYGKTVIEQNMDVLATYSYSANVFVMIDIDQGLIGVYEEAKPIHHIWQANLKDIMPGLYKLRINGNRLELYDYDSHAIFTIRTRAKDSRVFIDHVKQDIPAIVYGAVNSNIQKMQNII